MMEVFCPHLKTTKRTFNRTIDVHTWNYPDKEDNPSIKHYVCKKCFYSKIARITEILLEETENGETLYYQAKEEKSVETFQTMAGH